MRSYRQKLWTVGGIWGFDLLSAAIFAGVLGWI
jgi:hypothetical protein